jgi:hypothetical protein
MSDKTWRNLAEAITTIREVKEQFAKIQEENKQ